MKQAAVLLSTRTRLLLAALVCLVPMGFTWTYRMGWSMTTCTSYNYDTGACEWTYTGYYGGEHKLVSQSSLAAFLVFAALAFAIVAVRVRTAATLRLAQAGAAVLAVAILLALANGSARVAVLLAIAAALVLPPILRARRRLRARPVAAPA